MNCPPAAPRFCVQWKSTWSALSKSVHFWLLSWQAAEDSYSNKLQGAYKLQCKSFWPMYLCWITLAYYTVDREIYNFLTVAKAAKIKRPKNFLWWMIRARTRATWRKTHEHFLRKKKRYAKIFQSTVWPMAYGMAYLLALMLLVGWLVAS